eukprot:2241258-Amphidinium_carterae.2
MSWRAYATLALPLLDYVWVAKCLWILPRTVLGLVCTTAPRIRTVIGLVGWPAPQPFHANSMGLDSTPA